VIPPGTFHTPGLPKEWNAIIDKYTSDAKHRAAAERGRRGNGKKKGGRRDA